jgi:hypothetical protein
MVKSLGATNENKNIDKIPSSNLRKILAKKLKIPRIFFSLRRVDGEQ